MRCGSRILHVHDAKKPDGVGLFGIHVQLGQSAEVGLLGTRFTDHLQMTVRCPNPLRVDRSWCLVNEKVLYKSEARFVQVDCFRIARQNEAALGRTLARL